MSTILGLDIGTEFVKAILAKPGSRGVLRILAASKVRQQDGSMHAGAISDIPAVISACEEAVAEVEDAAKEHAEQTVVGIAGELIKGNTTSVKYTRRNKNTPISEAEMDAVIKRVQAKAGEVARQTIALETGNENAEVSLINSAIVSLTIDGYKISNPIGFKGSEVSILVYTAFAPMLHVAAIEKVCAELNLDLLTLAVEPFAVCRACLGDDLDADFSGIVIDIGGGTTDLAVVEDGGVEATETFSIGGRSFTHQIAESLGVDFATAEDYKLDYDSGKLDDALKSKVETAVSRNLSVWLTGIEVALESYTAGPLPRNVLLCGGGAGLSVLQEKLALSDWYTHLPFSRRPLVNLIDVAAMPGLAIPEDITLDYSYATALGLLRVGMDTIAGAPEANKLRTKIARLLEN